MFNLFVSLSKNTKIAIIISFILVLIILFFGGKTAYWKYQYTKTLEADFKILQEANKRLLKEVETANFERQMLNIQNKNNLKKIENLTEKLKSKKDEAIKIPDIVRDYDDVKLDSILSNYRHIQGTED